MPLTFTFFHLPGNAFDKATDKDYVHQLCLDLDIPVASGMCLDELMEQGPESTLSYPLVLRTRKQNIAGGKVPLKAAYARNVKELLNWHRQFASFRRQRPGSGIPSWCRRACADPDARRRDVHDR